MAKDLFSDHAKAYATFRPLYPQSLYDFIFSHVKDFGRAWDCGTGNGQVAQRLATRFRRVDATDISAKQLENAYKLDNVFYQISTAESAPFPEDSFDLISVGQAIHWFDRKKFYAECLKVGKQNSLLAVFGYSLVRGASEFNVLMDSFYYDEIYTYWEAERRIVDDQYQNMDFPFDAIPSPDFKISLEWTLPELQGYLNTWSAVQKYIKINGTNPVDHFIDRVKPLWKATRQSVYFPVFLNLGRIKK